MPYLCILLFLLFSPALSRASELSDTANAMPVGTWAVLQTIGLDEDYLQFPGGNGAPSTQFMGNAVWDPTNAEILFAGAGHENASMLHRYTASTNTWTRETTVGSGVFGHGYYMNAIDVSNRILGFLGGNKMTHVGYDLDTGSWTREADGPNAGNPAPSYVYFPDRDLWYAADGTTGIVRVWNHTAKTWAVHASELKCYLQPSDPVVSTYHHFAEYSPSQQEIMFGGGNSGGSPTTWSYSSCRMDSNGTITVNPVSPTILTVPNGGNDGALVTVDPASGDLLALTQHGQLYALRRATNVWELVPNPPSMPAVMKEVSVNVEGGFVVPIATYNVILYFDYPSKELWLYKHAAGTTPPPPPPPPPAGSTTFQSVHNSECITIPNDSMATGIASEQEPCLNTNNQLFILNDVGGGEFQLEGVNSGLCLEIEGASMANNAPLVQNTCDAVTHQRFRLQNSPSSLVVAHSGMCINAGIGTYPAIKQLPCGNPLSANEQWIWSPGVVVDTLAPNPPSQLTLFVQPPGTSTAFADLCALSTTIFCQDFSTPVVSVTATPGPTENIGNNNFTCDSIVNDPVEYCPEFVNGEMKFTVASESQAGSSGQYVVRFSDFLNGQPIGPGQEVFMQWRQKFSADFLNTLFDSTACGTGCSVFKQAIITAADEDSCALNELVVTSYPPASAGQRYPGMYHSCGLSEGFFTPVGASDFDEQPGGPGTICSFTDRSNNIVSPGCEKYYPDEWMTFQIAVTHGQPGEISRVRMWVGREGQPSVLALDDTRVLVNDKGYGRLWLLPYQTEKDITQVHPEGYVWYDNVIISTVQIPDYDLPGEITIPAPTEWTDQGSILTAGGTSDWDDDLPGISPCAAIKKDGTIFLYYVGADGVRSGGGPRHRALGVATSLDGSAFTKYSGNPILTWLPNSGEEEGIWSCGATQDTNGDIVLYYGALTETAPSLVKSDGRVATSPNGLDFTDQGLVLDSTDSAVWNNGDELMPVGVFQENGMWYVYYIGKGGVGDWLLGLASGTSLTNLSTTQPLITSGELVIAGGNPVALGLETLALPIVRSDAGFANPNDIEMYTVSKSAPLSLTGPVATYNFGNRSHATLLADKTLGQWFLYYRTPAETDIGLRTAPLIQSGP